MRSLPLSRHGGATPQPNIFATAPMTPAAPPAILAAVTVASSWSTRPAAESVNFSTGFLSVSWAALRPPREPCVEFRPTSTGFREKPFSVSTMASRSVMSCGALDISTPWIKERGPGMSKACRTVSGADVRKPSSASTPALRASMALPTMSFMPPSAPRGPSRSDLASAFFMGAVSIFPMSSGLSLPSSSLAMSFGSLARAFTEPSSCDMARSKPSARSFNGFCTSPANFVSVSTSAEESSPKARSFVCTLLV
mmetsp:Transcript_77213/g.214045  ORF Transcript_77213/g.214045 Transcript_77213/m.214045 type:complete len:253 (-) Transcript_77213:336-1094(-)